MAANVTVELTGDETRLLKAMQRVVNQQQKMDAGFEKTGEKGKKFGDVMVGGAKDVVSSLVGIASTAGIVMAAVKGISDEWRHAIDMQKEALRYQMTVEGAQQSLLLNLSGQSDETKVKALADARAIATETKVDEKFIAAAMADAVSASGGDVVSATAAVRQSAKVNYSNPDAIGGFAGSLLDLGTATESKDAEVNQGFLQKIGALSRVVNPQQQAQNIPKSIIGQVQMGATPQEAGALFSAMTVGSADFTGATSSTSSISLAEQMRGFFEKEGMTESFQQANGRTRTMGERITELQDSPELGSKFLASASFEKVSLGPIEALIKDRDSKAAQLFRSNLLAFGDNASLKAEAQDTIADQGLSPYKAVGDVSRAADSHKQSQDSDLGRSATDASRKALSTFRRDSGDWWWSRAASSMKFEAMDMFGKDPAQEALDQMLPTYYMKSSPQMQGDGERMVFSQDPAFDQNRPGKENPFYNSEDAQKLTGSIESLRALLESQQARQDQTDAKLAENTEALQENSKKTEDNTKSTGKPPTVRPPVNREGQTE